MYKYKNRNGYTTIILEKDGVLISIPNAEDNKDYQEYLKWVAEGNEAEEWTAQ
jgi:hypothetical protein